MAEKKVLENPLLAGMVVPLAVVLVAALIIFGITKMLTPERNHTQLVRELEAKRFGNRWIAAYELSKLINTSKIPLSEEPQLVADLMRIYDSAEDLRTKKFLVMAASALKGPAKLAFIAKASQDPIREVQFHAVVALANSKPSLNPDLSSLKKILAEASDKDPGLLQASILGLAHHNVPGANLNIRKLLGHPNFKVQMAAASGLVNFKDEAARAKVSEILLGSPEYFTNHGISSIEKNAVKVNMLEAILRVRWLKMKETVQKLRDSDEDIKVIAKASEILEEFKTE